MCFSDTRVPPLAIRYQSGVRLFETKLQSTLPLINLLEYWIWVMETLLLRNPWRNEAEWTFGKPDPVALYCLPPNQFSPLEKQSMCAKISQRENQYMDNMDNWGPDLIMCLNWRKENSLALGWWTLRLSFSFTAWLPYSLSYQNF